MNEEYKIKQTTGNNSDGDNIGVQNNYIGLPPEKAIEITIKLFKDNFPKLQEEAMETVNQRMDELQEKVFQQLAEKRIMDYTVFTDPDMQYAYYEAQNSYARFGTDELLNTLSDLIVTRVEKAGNDYLKRVIDSAISIVGKLTRDQINFLTLIFLIKNTKFGGIKSLEDLKQIYVQILDAFSPINSTGFNFLISLGCLCIDLDEVVKRNAKTYGYSYEEIESIMPQDFKKIPADYSTSDMGRIIAIVNARRKTGRLFEIRNFIDT